MPGDIVSFKHRGYLLGSKKPLTPALYRLRPDLNWEDVVFNFKDQKGKVAGETAHSSSWNLTPCKAIPSQKGKENQKPKGYWLSLDNRRKFFLQFAKDMGFPADSIDKWKQVTNAQILAKEV